MRELFLILSHCSIEVIVRFLRFTVGYICICQKDVDYQINTHAHQHIPAPMPMKMRQTINTTKAFGKTIIHVASTIRKVPLYKVILLPKLSEQNPPINNATNIPTQKDD